MGPPSKKSQNNKPKHAFNKFQKASTKKSFKTQGKSDVDIQLQNLPLQLEDNVPDFPRGGGSSLSREEVDEVRAKVEAEFETNDRDLKKKKRWSAQKKNPSPEDDLGSLFGTGITGKLPRFANKITFKNISPGMKLWGVIAEVNEKDMVVSLPGGLRGLVRAADAFDPLSDSDVQGDVEGNFLSGIYHSGQLVSCIVLQLVDDNKEKGKRKIWLSLRLSLLQKGFTCDVIQEGMVLSAYVKSIEDHGYILHFGMPSFTGFMPKKGQTESLGSMMKSGQIVQGVVTGIDRNRKVAYLSSDPDLPSKCVNNDLKGISIDLLIPGMLVNSRVQATLENGVLMSFLIYFTGTVDLFHLQNSFPTSNWKDDYNPNKKVNARILFIDPSSRAVGLTLNSHLLQNKAPPSVVKTGDIFEHSKVRRVDKGLGLLLEMPSAPLPTPAYVNVSDVADKEVGKLEKSFREGSNVRVRVLGFRHLEGLATGTLKTSAFEGPVFTHSDVKPGMVVKAKVIAVDSFGAIVQLASGVKALCPLRHMSEFEITKPRKKFQVGIELVFRVLGCKSKRITVTHKKTLVKSKFGVLSTYADATDGFTTHGWITKIEKHGCFVRFYNGVQGFAHRSELGLDPGCDISSIYHVEQVVKCRVTNSSPASRRINLSFVMTPARVSEDDMIKPGSLVSAVVEKVTPDMVVVCVNAECYKKGTIMTEHLADHLGLAALMKSVLKPGYEFDQLLVLDVESCNLVLSGKYSLINSAQQLPVHVSQVRPHSIVHGYVCNMIETGCFVRFLGRLTGFAPKNKATDGQRADLSEVFHVGQSVRSNVLQVSSETGRITVSLKQSLCSSTDASFIKEYFFLEDKIAKLQSQDLGEADLKWLNHFTIGSIVQGKVLEKKDIGVVISFEKFNDVFGFIPHYQLGGFTAEAGSTVQGAVLDVTKMERLVDLSLKPEIVNRFEEGSSIAQSLKKKRKRETQKHLEEHQTVNAVVEIVKENYLVLSIPECNFALGYASVTDYNTQNSSSNQFVNGQSVTATIMALPSPTTAGRLLLLLRSIGEVAETSRSKRARKKSGYDVGSLVQAEIIDVKPLELKLKFGSGFYGRVHITEANDDATEDPFIKFKIGQMLTARIISEAHKSYQWELSIKPSMLEGSFETMEKLAAEDFNFSTGQRVTGFTYKVDNEQVWLAVSRHVKAQLYILDSSCEPSELLEFQKRFHVGKPVSGYVLRSNKEKKLLRLVLHPLANLPEKRFSNRAAEVDARNSSSNENVAFHIHEGDVLGGRISKILPGVGGLLVQIDPHIFGKVHFTEISDLWSSNPLSGYCERQFVKCKVLEVCHSLQGSIHVDLSLRPSLNGMQDQKSVDLNKKHLPCQHVEKIEELRPNMVIQGYVKNVSPKGCFIMISRKLDAKILLSNLSDGFVENPEQEFPLGTLVVGKVVAVEALSKRVEVTLKASNSINGPKSDLSSLSVGNIILGKIKRVESYGLFISLDHTNHVGLCHISELSDDHIDSIETEYRAGDRVTAKILKLDEDRHRISLGMKKSYLTDERHMETAINRIPDSAFEETGLVASNQLTVLPPASSAMLEDIDIDFVNRKHPVHAEVESRASVPPLDVSLDEENLDMDNVVSHKTEHVDNSVTVSDKNMRRAKKKAREEKEREIMVAEDRLLMQDVPKTADDFEKLVRSSPNSSFVWIKYMAFMLALPDVEKARSIAERALRTINFRDEAEKLNIWVAYFNLENEYGDPPKDAVEKIFHRALQYCDPKKVFLALLGMYERTEQQRLADELLDKMTKKFKHSCKVWLRRIQGLLTQNQDGVQSLLNDALLRLPQHKHIKFITQVAILEFKCGVADRGRFMFEQMLREHPKRTDLWSLYLDQEIRHGRVDFIRALFERVITMKLQPKKMKFLFKRYLDYEKSLGDEEQVEEVKRKAMEYVESTLA